MRKASLAHALAFAISALAACSVGTTKPDATSDQAAAVPTPTTSTGGGECRATASCTFTCTGRGCATTRQRRHNGTRAAGSDMLTA